METFTTEITVRWQHCDPAGMIFTPRYFDMTHSVMEEWFDKALNVPFNRLHGELKRGVPTVHLEADFMAPSLLNDDLTFELTVAKLGKSSVTLSVKARCGEEKRLDALIVIAQVSLETMRAVPIEPALRAEMARYAPA